MTITMKQGNNLVIELSTAAYEVFRTELKEILRINTFLNSNYAVNYEPRYDEQEFIVEETYKVLSELWRFGRLTVLILIYYFF
jgi:hypothetical protein